MVEEAKCVLRNTKADPNRVAEAFKISEIACWQYLDDLNRALREAEQERDTQAIQEQVRLYVDSIPNKNNIRIEAIRGQLLDAKTHPEKYDVAKLLNEVKILKGTSEQITPQMIERAKAHPIGNLIELKRNTALCPFHNEKSPSFSVKDNKYKCFGCSASGDTISLVRHIKNMTFKEAVIYLQ